MTPRASAIDRRDGEYEKPLNPEGFGLQAVQVIGKLSYQLARVMSVKFPHTYPIGANYPLFIQSCVRSSNRLPPNRLPPNRLLSSFHTVSGHCSKVL